MDIQRANREKIDKLLWHSFPHRMQYPYISRFIHSSIDHLLSLPIGELVLLFQWLFEERGVTTVNVEIWDDYFDLDLVNKEESNRQEYARVYLTNPFSAVYNVTTHLIGRNIQMIHLITFMKFPPADWKAEQESPLFIRLKEGTDTIRWIGETRDHYRKSLKNKQDYYVIPKGLIGKPKNKSILGKIKQILFK
jgi:hypothetical protein